METERTSLQVDMCTHWGKQEARGAHISTCYDSWFMLSDESRFLTTSTSVSL
jgi:hypothetical protein